MSATPGFRSRLRTTVGHQLLFKDKVFTKDDWHYQKSWRRYLPRPLTSFRVFWGFSVVVVFLTLEAVCVCLYHAWLENVGAPRFWNHNTNLWQPLSLSSFCLALLLVHRTTASYNRWWEARTVWGGVLNVTRNLVREAASPWGFPLEARPLLDMHARWVTAMPWLLRAHIDGVSARADLEGLLPPAELDYVLAAKQPCLRCAQVVSGIVGRAMVGDGFQQSRVWIDHQLELYTNYVGACERILRTAIPLAFTRHLTRFLLTWLFLLPFCMWPVVGWATPAVQLIICFLLLGTENIGIQVEEPFCVMTMSAFCKSCERSVMEIMEGLAGTAELIDSVQASDKSWGFHRRKPEGKANGAPPGTAAPADMADAERRSFSDVNIRIRL